MNYIECNLAHDVCKLFDCYFEKVDVEVKLKRKKSHISYENGIMVEFLDCVKKAYVDCGLYLQRITTGKLHFESLHYYLLFDGDLA